MLDIYDKLKPFLIDLIQYHYEYTPNAGCGGSLHIATDDGNLGTDSIWFCVECAEKNDDLIGYLIAMIMTRFTEEELEEMYNTDFWGMHNAE